MVYVTIFICELFQKMLPPIKDRNLKMSSKLQAKPQMTSMYRRIDSNNCFKTYSGVIICRCFAIDFMILFDCWQL